MGEVKLFFYTCANGMLGNICLVCFRFSAIEFSTGSVTNLTLFRFTGFEKSCKRRKIHLVFRIRQLYE